MVSVWHHFFVPRLPQLIGGLNKLQTNDRPTERTNKQTKLIGGLFCHLKYG